MENIRDWCISRQLWWGHRIPAWYHKETGEVYVDHEPPADIENWEQDKDVLIHGSVQHFGHSQHWAGRTRNAADFKRYYPTDAL